jgi:hypothetical protein
MRFFILFLVVFSVSTFSEPITDFSPDQIGNTWKYQIVKYGGDAGTIIDSENYSKTFKLIKTEVTKAYKSFIFDIIDSGYTTLSPHTIQLHYYDTCFQFGDTLKDTLQNPNRGFFSPLFNSHAIDSQDSGIKKVLYKNDSLFLFATKYFKDYFDSYTFSYMQNIGLFRITGGYGPGGTMSYSFYSVNLISCTITPTSIAQPPKKFNPVQVQASHQNVSSAYIFDLQGRRFQQRSLSALPHGLMINHGINYLQVK